MKKKLETVDYKSRFTGKKSSTMRSVISVRGEKSAPGKGKLHHVRIEFEIILRIFIEIQKPFPFLFAIFFMIQSSVSRFPW